MVHYNSVLRACLLGSCAASIVPSDTNMDRRSVQVSTDKTLYCGIFGSGAKDTMATLEHDLVSGKHKKRVWTIGPGECNRVHCYQTTGIYVCKQLPNTFLTPFRKGTSLSPACFTRLRAHRGLVPAILE